MSQAGSLHPHTHDEERRKAPVTTTVRSISVPHGSNMLPAKCGDHRRHSLRSIKRRKFDDEIVESSLPSKGLRRSLDGGTPTDEIQEGVASPGTSMHQATSPTITATLNGPDDPSRPRNVAKLSTLPHTQTSVNQKGCNLAADKRQHKRKKLKKTRQAFAAVKDMGRWKPTDDILLIDAVERVGDLPSVHLAVKFSCYFTLEEVQERWYALLYDPVISGLARQAMKALPREKVKATHAKALFSKAEEELLCKIESTKEPDLKQLQDLLNENPTIFHPDRMAESLLHHWKLLQQYHLLNDQAVQPLPKGDHILNFSDAEDLLDDDALAGPRDQVLGSELNLADRRQKREIKQLEEENDRLKIMVSSVTNSLPTTEFDDQTVAVLQGTLVRYLMRSKEISLGRCTDDVTVDVDLSLEGPAFKVSRKQGTIKLKKNGEFVLSNIGKRPMFVDGKPVSTGSKCRLSNNSVLELELLRFVFITNQELIASSCTKNPRTKSS